MDTQELQGLLQEAADHQKALDGLMATIRPHLLPFMRRVREKAGLTMEEAGERMGWSWRMIAGREHRTTKWTAADAVRALRVWGEGRNGR